MEKYNFKNIKCWHFVAPDLERFLHSRGIKDAVYEE
jgi:hypothetical protein